MHLFTPYHSLGHVKRYSYRSYIILPRLSLFILLTLGFPGRAETPFAGLSRYEGQDYEITGHVFDEAQRPLAGVSIQLGDPSGRLAMLTITDSLGSFRIRNIIQGSYMLEIRCVGFKSIQQNIVIKSNSSNLGRFILFRTAKNLAGVEIFDKSGVVEYLADRIVYHTESSTLQKGGTALQAIQRIPGLNLSSDNIKLAGKGNLSILLGGKPIRLEGADLVEYIQNIPAESISKIELYTTAPAAFEAQGAGGILNIIEKKDATLGYSGNVNITQGRNSRPFGRYNGTFNMNMKRFRLNISPSYTRNNSVMFSNQLIYFDNTTWDQQEYRHLHNRSFRTSMNADFDIDQKNVISLAYSITKNNNGGRADNTGFFYSPEHAMDSVLSTASKISIPRVIHTVNLSSSSKIGKKGSVLKAEYSFFYNDADKVNSFITSSSNLEANSEQQYLPISSSNKQHANIHTANVELNIPGKVLTWRTGLKGTFFDVDNDAIYERVAKFVPAQNSTFRYTENTQAAWFIFNANGKKLMLQAGMRAEYTQWRGNSLSLKQVNSSKYFELFPSLSASININDEHTLMLRGGRRISRPGYSWLDPFRFYMAVNAYTEGNPQLKPYFTQSAEVTHIFRKVLSTTLEYTRTKDEYEKITIQDATDNAYSQRVVNQNFLNQQIAKLSVNYDLEGISWIESSNSVSSYYTRTRSASSLTRPRLAGWGNYLSSINNLILNKSQTLKAGVSIWYQFPEISGMDKMKRRWELDLASSYRIPGSKINITLSCNDVFKSSSSGFRSLINNTPQYYRQYNDVREIRLSLSYNFSKGKVSDNLKSKNNEDWGRAN